MNYNIKTLTFSCSNFEKCIEALCRIASFSCETDFRYSGTKITLFSQRGLNVIQMIRVKEMLIQKFIVLEFFDDSKFTEDFFIKKDSENIN